MLPTRIQKEFPDGSAMIIVPDVRKSCAVIARPDVTFTHEKKVPGYWPVLRWYLVLNIVLSLLTPVVDWFGVPCDIVNAGTNAQMGAYVAAPSLEASTGISRYFWVALLTYTGNAAKFPVIGLLFHGFAKILRGRGTLLDSFKVATYASAPVFVFGRIPLFGLISGLWAGYLYVVAFNKLHEAALGPTIALVNVLIGVQLVWAFVFGWMGSSTQW